MTAPRLTLGHGNGHNKPSLVDFVIQADADSFGCNEAHLLIPRLRRVPDHRVTAVGEDAADRRARSTAIVTRSELENLGQMTRKVSENVPVAEKFGPDRWLVASCFRHPLATQLGFEGVAHFALHPDATVAKRQESHPLVREYRESLDSTRRLMRWAYSDNLLPFLTGDLQVNSGFDREWGPRAQIVDRLEMSARVVRIDWIIYPKEVVLDGKLRTRQLFDHQGFVQSFKAASRKTSK